MKLCEVDQAIQSLLSQLEPDPETGEIPMEPVCLTAPLAALRRWRMRLQKS